MGVEKWLWQGLSTFVLVALGLFFKTTIWPYLRKQFDQARDDRRADQAAFLKALEKQNVLFASTITRGLKTLGEKIDKRNTADEKKSGRK